VRLDGDEMTANADDGDAGHFPERTSGHITPASVRPMRRTSVVSWERSGSGSDFDPVCSFCGKKRSDGNRRFIAGPAGVYICEDCVHLCVEALEEEPC
jgi:hypothetical protein